MMFNSFEKTRRCDGRASLSLGRLLAASTGVRRSSLRKGVGLVKCAAFAGV